MQHLSSVTLELSKVPGVQEVLAEHLLRKWIWQCKCHQLKYLLRNRRQPVCAPLTCSLEGPGCLQGRWQDRVEWVGACAVLSVLSHPTGVGSRGACRDCCVQMLSLPHVSHHWCPLSSAASVSMGRGSASALHCSLTFPLQSVLLRGNALFKCWYLGAYKIKCVELLLIY